VTPITAPVTMAGMDDLDQQYRGLGEHVRRYPMPEAARAAILAEIEWQYRAALEGGVADRAAELAGGDLDPPN